MTEKFVTEKTMVYASNGWTIIRKHDGRACVTRVFVRKNGREMLLGYYPEYRGTVAAAKVFA